MQSKLERPLSVQTSFNNSACLPACKDLERNQSLRSEFMLERQVDSPAYSTMAKRSFDHYGKKSWPHDFRNLVEYNSIAQLIAMRFILGF